MKKQNAYVLSLVKQMSLDEKIGALLTLGFAGVVPKQNVYDYITKYHCGGLRLSPEFRVFGNYVDPNSSKTVVKVKTVSGLKYDKLPPVCTASEYKGILDELQSLARAGIWEFRFIFPLIRKAGAAPISILAACNCIPSPWESPQRRIPKWPI